MPQDELETWAAVCAVGVAVLALLVSFLSFRNSSAALRLSKAQDERRRPTLKISYRHGYQHVDNVRKIRDYGFLVSIGNPSDIDNSAAQIELHVSYSLRSGEALVAKFPCLSERGDVFPSLDEFKQLSSSEQIGAHLTVSGWCLFRVAQDAIADFPINGYKLVVIDTHGNETFLEAGFVKELEG
ncbi:hypothetical protein T8K17_01135 [Thalassobaculum sp. OXR-137]|uniref:hypothetical protein n=1 Tax=Thalassobaculum sp. OXR-137 TaxID=3100173 RepID=UPI002AC9220C|nr:hypothetical protein [Thalassobaculum sp. OXR-137]WPZ34752.1 hypothetical protein T8K17_01135 [Thalassobaculum sp. OXR-137]